ncbi:hypothetical protein DL96DRAFT_719434 [Flagelloscypha sp. PMI_526]|nr:hypothetical protein DL96DRAFT_719434 [Flagelloscypha sp. PMI_526]
MLPPVLVLHLGSSTSATSSLASSGVMIDDAARREFHELLSRELDLDLEARAGFSSLLGKASNIAGIGSLAATLLGGLFGGGDDAAAARRELADLVSREIDLDMEARAGFSSALGKASNIAGIGSLAATLLGSLFGGDDAARREEFTDLVVRHMEAREIPVDVEARAGFSSLLGKASNIAGIGSLAATLLGGLFGGDDAARREFTDLMTRELAAREIDVDLDARAGFSSLLGKASNIAGLGSLAATLLGGLFGGGDDAAADPAAAPARRELEALIARELNLDMEARAGFSSLLGKASNIAGIGSLAATLLGGLFGGGDDAAAAPARRELEALIARELNLDMEARAGFSSLLGKASNIAGIGSLAATLLGGLFGGGDDAAAAPAARELMASLSARAIADLD